MLEKIENAILFHQPGYEVEARLAVLDAVITRLVRCLQRIGKIVEPQIRKDRLDDVGNGLVLKDAAIGGARQKPHPWDHFGIIRGEGFIRAALAKAADNPVEVSGRPVRLLHGDGHVFSDDVGETDAVVFGKQVQFEAKEARNSLQTPKALQQKFVLPQRCVNLK